MSTKAAGERGWLKKGNREFSGGQLAGVSLTMVQPAAHQREGQPLGLVSVVDLVVLGAKSSTQGKVSKVWLVPSCGRKLSGTCISTCQFLNKNKYRRTSTPSHRTARIQLNPCPCRSPSLSFSSFWIPIPGAPAQQTSQPRLHSTSTW